MNIDDFIEVSIRGRVAYALTCLELLLENPMNTDGAWKSLIEKLWSFTNREYLDDWHEEMAESIPNVICQYEDYVENEFDLLDEKEFLDLKEIYSKSNDLILSTIDRIFYIGTVELYGNVEKPGIQSLIQLEELLKLLKCNNLELPDVRFLESKKFGNDGWGDSFVRKDVASAGPSIE